jgi:Lipase (class 3)
MTTTKDLLLAILAMDSYNQGYGAGLVTGATQIGSANLFTDSSIKLSETTTKAAGFYAAAYDTPYGKVISYRGTDVLSLNPFGASDIYNGWLAATGLQTSQVGLAYGFYNSVLSTPEKPITYESGAQANVILTGHSLGGGLAGMVAGLSGTEAFIFDQMPFGDPAIIKYIFDHPTVIVNPNDWPNILKLSQITAESTSHEILSLARGFFDSSSLGVTPTTYDAYATSYWSYDLYHQALNLHMMDLLVNLKFADMEEKGTLPFSTLLNCAITFRCHA